MPWWRTRFVKAALDNHLPLSATRSPCWCGACDVVCITVLLLAVAVHGRRGAAALAFRDPGAAAARESIRSRENLLRSAALSVAKTLPKHVKPDYTRWTEDITSRLRRPVSSPATTTSSTATSAAATSPFRALAESQYVNFGHRRVKLFGEREALRRLSCSACRLAEYVLLCLHTTRRCGGPCTVSCGGGVGCRVPLPRFCCCRHKGRRTAGLSLR